LENYVIATTMIHEYILWQVRESTHGGIDPSMEKGNKCKGVMASVHRTPDHLKMWFKEALGPTNQIKKLVVQEIQLSQSQVNKWEKGYP
jgi:hypothetical protein